tara:strand:+ start:140 stop:391 length:252 start_codon:yes stop_codon:yes gene_type:complete
MNHVYAKKINKIILGEYIWRCQKEDNRSLEVKREELITNLVWSLLLHAHNVVLQKCLTVHVRVVDITEAGQLFLHPNPKISHS